MLTNLIRHLGVGMLVPSLIFKTSRFMHWGGSHVPVGIVQFIIVFALKLSSPLLLFQPIIVLFVTISFVSCHHFKGMLLVEILPGKGLIRVPGQILDRIIYVICMEFMGPKCKCLPIVKCPQWQRAGDQSGCIHRLVQVLYFLHCNS